MISKIDYKSDIGKKLASKYDLLYNNLDNETIFRPIKKNKLITTNDSPINKEIQKKEYPKLFKVFEKENTQKIPETKHKLNLHDLVSFYKNQGIVGEEKLVCAITLAAINHSSFGVEGFSGSGKTFVVDKLVDKLLLDVYKIQQSSDMAIFNDLKNINGSKFIYIPELQKAMKNKKAPIIEVIKDLTEGKDSNRMVTRKNGDGVDTFSIKKGVTIIYTLALENDFKKDDESSRRLTRFETDSSEYHLKAIHDNKAKQRRTLGEIDESKINLENKVKNHINACIDLDNVQIIDPFADYINTIMPKTQKSVGYIDHYYSLLDGCGKFHFNERKRLNSDGKTCLLLNLEDHFSVYSMYFNDFSKTLESLANKDERVHSPKPNWAQCLYSGYNVLKTSKELETLRKNGNDFIDKWYHDQIDENIVKTVDYKTGKDLIITQIGEVDTNVNFES